MYRAKQQGRNRYAAYSPSLHEDLSDLLKLESDLHGALAGDQLASTSSPGVARRRRGRRGRGAGALGASPARPARAPTRSSSIAEETGLIVEIDAWVLREACSQARRWLDDGLPPLRVARQPRRPATCTTPRSSMRVATTLGKSRLEAARSAARGDRAGWSAWDPTRSSTPCRRLKRLGVSLAVDDFGTGSSGLSSLRNCPVDTLKIDKTFVQEVTSDQRDVPLLAAMIGLARDLGLSVVAEGVETTEQADFLRRHAATSAQGYLFGRPMDVERFTRGAPPAVTRRGSRLRLRPDHRE